MLLRWLRSPRTRSPRVVDGGSCCERGLPDRLKAIFFMIEVSHVTKRYGDLTAIDRVSFTVEKGEVLAFLGPNGAGKTTTMRILTCFMPASEGTARVAGFDCFEQPQEVKRRVGYLPETPPLYQELTVTEYLTFTGRLKGSQPAIFAPAWTESSNASRSAMFGTASSAIFHADTNNAWGSPSRLSMIHPF